MRGKPIKAGGLKAYEILADALDNKTGIPLRVYQVIIEGTDQDFLVQGMVGGANEKAFLPEFRRLTSTFRIANP